MHEDGAFTFTDVEVYEAFRLVMPDHEAERMAAALRATVDQGVDWAASEGVLLLLSLATPGGRAKVDRVRKSGQTERLTLTLSPASDDRVPLEARVRSAAAEEDRRWEELRCGLRRDLRAQGKIVPDDS